MGFHRLVNTQYFREAALDFKKNGGIYTKAPRGSRDYVQYWEEQERRCTLGYQVGDLWIPGKHYFYLNFTPILRIPDSSLARVAMQEHRNHKGKISAGVMNKILDFPRFFEIDYEWYNFKHIAWYGGEFMGIKSDGAKHLCALKTRGAGWSYKEASEGVYIYNFIEKSKSYYFASLEDYLIKDGILSKVKEMLDFINDNIPRWRQTRMKRDNPMYYKASYLTKEGIEKGNKSEIFGLTVNNPNKTRGKRGQKITFEEAGSFKNLKAAYDVCVGSITDGDFKVGQISVFGTGGEEGPSIEGLSDMFNDPHTFGMLAFPNVYEEGMEGTECGYFVPCYRANIGYMDEDGNVDLVGALRSDEQARLEKGMSKDPKDLDRRKAEYPRTPSEALQRLASNIFNVTEVNKQIQYMKANHHLYEGLLRNGYLAPNKDGKMEFQIDANARPVREYPHKPGDDLTGCITIWEPPFHDKHGMVPEDMYFITVDPCQKEETEDTTSIFSVYVWKNYNGWDPKNEGLPVAWYHGRPEDFEIVYQHIFALSDYYNCKIQSEIAGGGQGIIDYAKRPDVRKLHRLEYEPEFILAAEDVKKFSGNVPRFMNMPTEKKRLGMTYLAGWHRQLRAGHDDGKPVWNIHRCPDIGMLQEMGKFRSDGNFDRLSSALIAMFMLKEYVLRAEEEASDNADFYTRPLFGGEAPQSNNIVDGWGEPYSQEHGMLSPY